MRESRFWDLGEATVIHPSKKSLGIILDAIVRLHGKIHDSHCMELDESGDYRYPITACAVLFRISLPVGAEQKFCDLTGMKLTEPPKVGIN